MMISSMLASVEGSGLDLAEVIQDGVYEFKRLIDLFTHFGAGQNYLAAHKNQQHDFRLHHAVDQAREEFWLVR